MYRLSATISAPGRWMAGFSLDGLGIALNVAGFIALERALLRLL